MMNGVVVGIVVDNVDPDTNGKIKCKYPVDGDPAPETWWLRLMSPMAGKSRGLVMLPDIGTEVLIGFAYKTNSPYILGALYNGGEDKPKPYANEDGNNDHRRFWSRNSHWIDFDDTAGAERIEITSTTANNAIYQEFHAANKVITQKVEKHIIQEVETDKSIAMEAKVSAVIRADAGGKIDCGTTQVFKASMIYINAGSPGTATPALTLPTHKHPPTK